MQFDRKPETLDQFLRSVTPNTGPYDAGVISDAMAALFNKTGPGILFSHSQAGGPGWLTAIKSENVKGIVALEPGSGFIFPEGELPAAMPSAAGTLTPESVPLADFKKLTRIPIVIYYGDNFPVEPTAERGPVSYTHLDVYKRQGWRRSPMTNTTPAKRRRVVSAVVALSVGLATTSAYASQQTEEPQTMTSATCVSKTLTARQQTLSLIHI